MSITIQLSDVPESVHEWLKTASIADIVKAIEYGAPCVDRVSDGIRAGILKKMEDLKTAIRSGTLSASAIQQASTIVSAIQKDTSDIASIDTPTPITTSNITPNITPGVTPGVTPLSSPVQNRLTTTRIGQQGEAFIERMLRERYRVTNVTTVAHSGDLTLMINHHKIIVEVKNYTNTVPQSGIAKFRRDMVSTNASGGIFVSLGSPIVGITDNFDMRFETIETATVPCAYVVSTDPAIIFTAIEMVVKNIASCQFVNAELYNKDKVIATAHKIADKLDDVTRSRTELQDAIGDISRVISKASIGIASAEAMMRGSIDTLKDELFRDVVTSDPTVVIESMEKLPLFAKYSPNTKELVYSVIRHIHTARMRLGPNAAWKCGPKKCMCVVTGCGFGLYAGRVDVIIPRTRATADELVTAFDIFGKKISIDDTIRVVLDDTTVKWIKSVIDGSPAIDTQKSNESAVISIPSISSIANGKVNDGRIDSSCADSSRIDSDRTNDRTESA